MGNADASVLSRHSTGELLSHALSDVDVIRQVAAMGITTAISGLFMLGASTYLMITEMHWQLAVAGLSPCWQFRGLFASSAPESKSNREFFNPFWAACHNRLRRSSEGYGQSRPSVMKPLFLSVSSKRVTDLVNQKMKFVRLSTVFGALIPLMSAFGFIAVIWYGSYLTINRTITLGNLVAFLLYLTLLRQPLEQLGNMLNTVQRASASLARITTLLDVVPDTVELGGIVSTPPATGNIEARNLTFRYPGSQADALSNVSFTLRAGETLGIVGPIGSGKTTLAHLLLRLYEPPAGSIFIDGTDIRDYSLEHLRTAITYVPQNSFLFSTSISANIAFSDNGIPITQESSPHPEFPRSTARYGNSLIAIQPKSANGASGFLADKNNASPSRAWSTKALRSAFLTTV